MRNNAVGWSLNSMSTVARKLVMVRCGSPVVLSYAMQAPKKFYESQCESRHDFMYKLRTELTNLLDASVLALGVMSLLGVAGSLTSPDWQQSKMTKTSHGRLFRVFFISSYSISYFILRQP